MNLNAALPPLLLVLLWALIGGTNLDRPALDRAGAALSDLALAEVSLRTDILSARAGLLRDYDPIVADKAALHAALDRLHRAGVKLAGLQRMDMLVQLQSELTERFKSDNALLQNALAYFADYSRRIDTVETRAAPVAAARALAASMLQLTLNTSPQAEADVDAQLGQLALQAGPDPSPSVASLLSHGRLLRWLLPDADALVRGLFGLPWASAQQMADAALWRARQAAHERAAEYRLLLTAACVLMLGLLTHLGFRLRRRSLTRQRAARFDRLLTDISVRLMAAGPAEIGAALEEALGRLAGWIGAEQASFLSGATYQVTISWHAAHLGEGLGWQERQVRRLAEIAAGSAAQPASGVAYVRRVSRLEPGELKDLLARAGAEGWVSIARAAQQGSGSLLALATTGRPLVLDDDDAGLLRMALDTFASAVARAEIEAERLRLEAGLQRWRRMETIAALTGGVAHNFNNIVAAILGHAEIAEARETDDAELARSLAQIRRAGERARDLTDQILAFGRRREFASVPVEMRALLAETRAQLGVMLPPGIMLAPHGPDHDLVVLGEAVQLQQVVVNLCNNAAQAMQGDGTVELGLAVQVNKRERVLSHGVLLPGTWVVVSVRDGGRGIDPSTLPRIFEPFFTTRRNGNGLGLATVRDIVIEHGGQIDVSSRREHGSLFEVYLPLATSYEQLAGAPPPAPPRGALERVLVFNARRAGLLRDEEFVAAFGYEPVGFSDPAEVLREVAAAPDCFDLALLAQGEDDAVLALANELRTLAPLLGVLVTTGKETGAVAARADQPGIVTSAAEPSRLAVAIARMLASRRRLAA